MSKLTLILISLLALGCTGQKSFMSDVTSGDQGSQGDGGSNTSPLSITISQPQENLVTTAKFDVIVDVTPLDQMNELKLFINGQEHHRFTRHPFKVQVDPLTVEGCSLTLRLEAKDKSNRIQKKSRVVKKTQDCAGGGDPVDPETPPSSKDAGTFDPGCLTNGQHDACIFWKNPVAQKGSSYASVVRFGQNLAEQTFGVRIEGLSSPNRLQNSTINVSATNGARAQPQNGRWIFPYQNDASPHHVAQVMAYFWLNYQEQQMLSRTGTFYAKGKNIPVDAYNTSVPNNAYWDTQNIVMGVVTSSNQNVHEMALSAEVYLHEMGHANLHFAVGRYLRDSNTNGNQAYCATKFGCVGAINEGQADFHFNMLFYENTALGETFVNNMNGISSFGISRDVRKIKAMKVDEFYSRSSGEIHGMGSAYASILWEIYNHPNMKKSDFEKIFSLHLQKLTESTRFPEAREILISEDQAHFGGRYRDVIMSVFTSKGL